MKRVRGAAPALPVWGVAERSLPRRKNMRNKGWTWLCHHEVLLEWCDDYKGRAAYIRREKPAHEVPVRLEWFRFVKCKLPPEVVQAWAARDKAWAAYDKAWAAYDKARAAYDKARAAYDKAWAACDKAWAACDKALAACDKAWAARDKAWAAYDKAVAKHMPEIVSLYRNECPGSPWNGRTLFPQ